MTGIILEVGKSYTAKDGTIIEIFDQNGQLFLGSIVEQNLSEEERDTTEAKEFFINGSYINSDDDGLNIVREFVSAK
ncbi:hypothetical protein A3A09_03185 [Candidatus Nomurabacteria bacterium RIFCSPLOWO2_01_FULL_42_20]|uniref:Uncharacterized protein n=1 Tax=Candidatus Nomurabacteria bacterium RIFCSPHIGHO2_01_FULL_42_16 TaxID=1801743 RepID=A0A1F6VL74_9BACT|nr:MAG: hypothetical protein A2824_02460 [Candidatus Nomurabacteria bacterium RIFCSPHIGHO2_01_FULL_42_16]OGI92676.1 MAG: hypothetical protein A3A09_03185 [Candidatus Nomurabacteria bacterium RIFCSPLOWO2_01_FULL_42_20]